MVVEAAQESPAEGRARPRTGAGRILVPAAAFLLLAGGGAAWLFGPLGSGSRAEASRELPSEAGALFALDPFVVNLADEDADRYLKATVQLEFFGGRVPRELNARLPQIRDLLLTLFTSKPFADVRAAQGKAELRDEIVNRVNHALRRDLVKAVYFTEFVVQ